MHALLPTFILFEGLNFTELMLHGIPAATAVITKTLYTSVEVIGFVDQRYKTN
jgi:hypothetical protein